MTLSTCIYANFWFHFIFEQVIFHINRTVARAHTYTLSTVTKSETATTATNQDCNDGRWNALADVRSFSTIASHSKPQRQHEKIFFLYMFKMLHLKNSTLMRGAHAILFPSVTAKVAKGTMNTISAKYGSLHCTALHSRQSVVKAKYTHTHTYTMQSRGKEMVALSPYQSTVHISLAVCFVNVDITSNLIYVQKLTFLIGAYCYFPVSFSHCNRRFVGSLPLLCVFCYNFV